MGAVFVTDGDQRATLAVVRALGKAGIEATVGSTRRNTLAGSSRYCTHRVCYPSPLEDSRGFQEFLARELRRTKYELFLPMTDVCTLLAAEIRDQVEPFAALPIPPTVQVRNAQDKGYVLGLAQKIGIGCPQTTILNDGREIESVASTMRYPVFIKPKFSRFRTNGHWVIGPVSYAHDSEDLIQKYRSAHARIPFPLIQERVTGEGRGVFLLVWDGELKAALCHRRLREKPPWGGVSVYRETIPLDEQLVDQSFALLKALSWKGVAMVEFKVDSECGLPKLMEINGRFWGSLQLAIDAGMNFPLMLYRLACGENPRAQFDYQAGVKSRWLLGDLDHLLIRLAGDRSDLFLPAKSKLNVCRDFLNFREPGVYDEIFRSEDPAPGWFEIKSYVRDSLQGLRRGKETDRVD